LPNGANRSVALAQGAAIRSAGRRSTGAVAMKRRLRADLGATQERDWHVFQHAHRKPED
jgi:hypothetical protein